MDTFLARQAVFDRGLNVYGYELLFRSGLDNAFAAADPERATSQVVESLLNTFGLQALTAGRKTFVNATRTLLEQDFASLLPPATTVIEIQEGMAQDGALVDLCGKLKKKGYLFALDAYRPARSGEPLVALADILKIDFRATTPEERRECVRRHAGQKVRLLAAKVETRRELSEAMEQGYAYFQGYFFCRPEMASRKEIPAYKVNYLRFLREVNQEEADYDRLEEIIQRDVALSLKLLRYINSAMFSFKDRVQSLRQAMALVGLAIMKRWASLLALAAMSDDRPRELVVTALVRARFCEQVGLAAGMGAQGFDLFMVGMLSAMDAILDRPMLEIVNELPLSAQARDALMGKPGDAGKVLGLMLAYERAEWDRLPVYLDRLPMDVLRIPVIYRESVAWAEQIFRAASAA